MLKAKLSQAYNFPITFWKIFALEVLLISSLRFVQAFFILYFTKHLFQSKAIAVDLLSYLGILTYSMPVIAGYLSDTFSNMKSSMNLGIILLLVGYTCVLTDNLNIIIIGLTLIGLGSGFFKPKLPILLNDIFDNEEKRSHAFSKFYIASNLGSFIASIVGGALYNFYGVRVLYAPLILVSIGSIIFLRLNNSIFKIYKSIDNNFKKLIPLLVFTLSSLIYALYLNKALIAIVGALGIMIYVIYRSHERSLIQLNNLGKLFWILSICIIYLILLTQPYYSYSFYLETFVNKKIFTFNIPHMWFLSINPLTIIIMGLTMKNFNGNIPYSKKVIYSFTLMLISYFINYGSFKIYSNDVPCIYLILSYIIMACGEFILIPGSLKEFIKMMPQKLNQVTWAFGT